MNTLLVVDDEKSVRYSFERIFENYYNVLTAEDGRSALDVLDRSINIIDVIFLDVRMPDMNGIEALKKIREKTINIPVIIMTAYSDSNIAIEAMREGAFDYLLKPLRNEQLHEVVEKALASARLRQVAFCCSDENFSGAETIVGRSSTILELCKKIGQASGSDIPVLITGESGVGKEIVARAIYNHSRRKGEAFMAVNCAALPEGIIESELFGSEKGAFTGADRKRIGRFEQCHGGTIFLDEIGDMHLSAQAKLLRVLQDGSFERLGSSETIRTNVRIIAASNKNLRVEAEHGRFREDLFHRLNVFPIYIPPLRERKEDIQLLAEYFIARSAKGTTKQVKGISPEALEMLMSHNWPGNVRELENVIKRAVVVSTGDIIGVNDLDIHEKPLKKELCALTDVIDSLIESAIATEEHPDIYTVVVSSVEKQLIEKVLEITKGNKQKASELLGITRVTLRKKIQQYNIVSG
ncbi:MAG: sigma-54-dependent Fis family transcriptional regulator [Nitrospiraceae bacterium]|nr:MAG: sigma-54-dependent Fis family transcriptional regulator [Nitrospiraceae bacterium]